MAAGTIQWGLATFAKRSRADDETEAPLISYPILRSLKELERELAHDMYDDGQGNDWWWDGRRPLYVDLYAAAAREQSSTFISVPPCRKEEQYRCEQEGQAALVQQQASARAAAGAAARAAARAGQCSRGHRLQPVPAGTLPPGYRHLQHYCDICHDFLTIHKHHKGSFRCCACGYDICDDCRTPKACTAMCARVRARTARARTDTCTWSHVCMRVVASHVHGCTRGRMHSRTWSRACTHARSRTRTHVCAVCTLVRGRTHAHKWTLGIDWCCVTMGSTAAPDLGVHRLLRQR